MLLSLMRKNAKSWLIKFLMVIIAVVFVFYFGYSFTSDDSGKIATINGKVISTQDYQKAYYKIISNLQSQYGDAWNENLIKTYDLERTTLNSIVQQTIITQEAERIGLDIKDKEVQDNIIQYQDFYSNGVFDRARYESLLANNDMTTEDFEDSISKNLLSQKFSQFLSTFLVLSDQEIRDQYIYANKEVKISFISLTPDTYLPSVTVDQALMEKYFDDYKENYRIPAKIKISYISVSPDEFKGSVSVSDDEIRTYYEDNGDLFTEPKKVRARHILFYLASDASEETEKVVLEKATSVLEKAKAGEDFAKLAQEYSEDTTTKENGGDLGYFQEGQMVSEFEDAAFGLDKDEISDLVRTYYGYHIIKVDDIQEEKVADLNDVYDQIKETFINNESKDLAYEDALTLIDRMPYDVDIMQYAGENGVAATGTDYFSADQPVYFLSGQTSILNAIFSLQAKEVSDVVELNNKYYIIQVADKKNSYIPAMSEVATQVEEDYKKYLAEQKTRAVAEEYLSRLKGGTGWEALAAEDGLTVRTTGFFTRLDYPEETGYVQGLQTAAFNLNQDNRYPDNVLENETGAFIIRWEEERGIDEDKFKEEKDTYYNGILSTKQQYISSSWLSRIMDKADIDVSGFEKNK